MASDLIYREDAKVFVRHACYKKINPIDYLDEVPAADVRPVVRGEWEPNERHDDCLVCTKCGCGYPAVGFAWIDCNRRSDERESAVFITDIMNFCPNCGADMREVSEDG